jgi:hypothetical protein
MRFAALVALAVVASTTPGFAAPTPYTYVSLQQQFSRPIEHTSSPNRPNSKRDTATTDVDNVVNALVQNGTVSANLGTAIMKLVKCVYPQLDILE